MKLKSSLFLLLATLFIGLSSCENSEPVEETNFDNEALFNEIQTSLETRKISLAEYSEMSANAHGTPHFFREFGDLTFEEFSNNFDSLTNAEMHDKLMSLKEQITTHKTPAEN